MRTIERWIDINAPAKRVWNVLTQFDAYPNWNPFIVSIQGVLRVGTKLRVRIKPPGRSGMTFRPTILALIPQQNLTWLGRLTLPGLLDGEHQFQIEDHGETCRFRQSERFSGILVPLLSAGLFDAIRRGFEETNVALKQHAKT
jgi:hypothetical protein